MFKVTKEGWPLDRFFKGDAVGSQLISLEVILEVGGYQAAPIHSVHCFFSDFEVRRNKSHRDRFQLLGRTSGGRRLKIIFQLKPGNLVRIIPGWDR